MTPQELHEYAKAWLAANRPDATLVGAQIDERLVRWNIPPQWNPGYPNGTYAMLHVPCIIARCMVKSDAVDVEIPMEDGR